ncbi:nucleotidyltransferase domain-containing protein [Peribacillus butanolivorans]|uniref:nucleotidyltransferase domain-containing protein n=1 Tax=Peribacillus butanolivorans TaxID=421767 RepID=UPI00366FBB58
MDNNYSLDLSIIPKELRLLLEIIRTGKDDINGQIKNEWFTDINWDDFLYLARHHRIYPLVYSKLKKFDKELIPIEIIQTLYHEYKKNTYQMLQLCAEMEQVSNLFTEHQIRLLFLKGPVIAADIYGDISLRTSKDLDILIPRTDLKKTEELLLNQGYERVEVLPTLYEWKWSKHHVTYFHPKKRIELEIHWRLHPAPSKEPNFNELWERKRISKLTSYPVYFLGDEDLFLFLVDHGARHGWFRLRWLVDIDQMIRKRIINEKNNALLKNLQQHYLGRHALILSSQLLNTPINEEMQSLTTGKRSRKQAQMAIFYIIEMGNSLSDEPFSIKLNLHKSFVLNLYQFSIKSNLQKVFYIIKLFYPSPADTEILRLPKSLQFLYFPLRPFLWVWRKTMKPI